MGTRNVTAKRGMDRISAQQSAATRDHLKTFGQLAPGPQTLLVLTALHRLLSLLESGRWVSKKKRVHIRQERDRQSRGRA